MPLCLLDDGRQISTSTIFHKNVQYTCVTVNIAVVVLDNMSMVEILQNVASCGSGQALPCYSINNVDEHLGHNLLAITFIHALEIDLLPS
jgi:hypothetical protein